MDTFDIHGSTAIGYYCLLQHESLPRCQRKKCQKFQEKESTGKITEWISKTIVHHHPKCQGVSKEAVYSSEYKRFMLDENSHV